jgi:hypothetical protein
MYHEILSALVLQNGFKAERRKDNAEKSLPYRNLPSFVMRHRVKVCGKSSDSDRAHIEQGVVMVNLWRNLLTYIESKFSLHWASIDKVLCGRFINKYCAGPISS